MGSQEVGLEDVYERRTTPRRADPTSSGSPDKSKSNGTSSSPMARVEAAYSAMERSAARFADVRLSVAGLRPDGASRYPRRVASTAAEGLAGLMTPRACLRQVLA